MYLERRLLGETASVAVQGKFGAVEDTTRITGGAVARFFLEPAKVMFLAEGNIVHGQFSGWAEDKFVGLAGFTFLPKNSVFFTFFAERSQTSIQVRDSATDALTGLLNWFPYPHTELQLMGRLQRPAGTETASTVLLQVHYWL